MPVKRSLSEAFPLSANGTGAAPSLPPPPLNGSASAGIPRNPSMFEMKQDPSDELNARQQRYSQWKEMIAMGGGVENAAADLAAFARQSSDAERAAAALESRRQLKDGRNRRMKKISKKQRAMFADLHSELFGNPSENGGGKNKTSINNAASNDASLLTNDLSSSSMDSIDAFMAEMVAEGGLPKKKRKRRSSSAIGTPAVDSGDGAAAAAAAAAADAPAHVAAPTHGRRLRRKRKQTAHENDGIMQKKNDEDENNDGRVGSLLPLSSSLSERIWNDESVFDESDILVSDDFGVMSHSFQMPRGQGKKEVHSVDHSEIVYEPLHKNLYIESPRISRLSDSELNELKQSRLGHDCKIRGKDIPRPIFEWNECGLPSEIRTLLKVLKLERPFPIQCAALPCIMSGRDVMASARTGSGKTLAFLLPMIRHVLSRKQWFETQSHSMMKDNTKSKKVMMMSNVDSKGPIALILAPTRELVTQLYLETRRFGGVMGVSAVPLYGGAPLGDQIAMVRRGCDIVVGTPGRVIDLLTTNQGRLLSLRRVSMVVLDEADRMFDLGFGAQMSEIMKNIRPDRQSVMFSATFPKAIELACKDWLNSRRVRISIGVVSTVSEDVSQFVRICRDDEHKFNELLKVLGQWYGKGLILVFADTRESVDWLYQSLYDCGYPSLILHGGVDQTDRVYTLAEFKAAATQSGTHSNAIVSGSKSILIATSICARGLDVCNLKVVINYHVPHHYEDYIHRVGRCGRAGNRGVAYTFIRHCDEERRYAVDVLKALQKSSKAQGRLDQSSIASDHGIPPELFEMVESFYDSVNIGDEKVFRKRGFIGKGFAFDTEDQNQHPGTQRGSMVNSLSRALLGTGNGAEVLVEKRDGSDDNGGLDGSDSSKSKEDGQSTMTFTTQTSDGDSRTVELPSIIARTLAMPSSVDDQAQQSSSSSRAMMSKLMSVAQAEVTGLNVDSVGEGGTKTTGVASAAAGSTNSAIIARIAAKSRSSESSSSSSSTMMMNDNQTSHSEGAVSQKKSKDLELARNMLAKIKKMKQRNVDDEKIKRKIDRQRELIGRRREKETLLKQAAVQEKLNESLNSLNRASLMGVSVSDESGNSNSTMMDGIDDSYVRKGELLFLTKIEINDFPDEVRKRICFRTTLHHVRSNYSVKISQRGVFVPIGRKAKGDGVEKLHLLVEGSKTSDVRNAAKEIHRLLREVSCQFIGKDESSGYYSKFRVV